jgi:hypothetical protein
VAGNASAAVKTTIRGVRDITNRSIGSAGVFAIKVL